MKRPALPVSVMFPENVAFIPLTRSAPRLKPLSPQPMPLIEKFCVKLYAVPLVLPSNARYCPPLLMTTLAALPKLAGVP